MWIDEVATDGDASWDLTQLRPAGPYVVPWAVAVDEISIAHPRHQVLWILWVQDSFWLFNPPVTWVDDLDLDGYFLGSPKDLKSRKSGKSENSENSEKSKRGAKGDRAK